VTIVRSTYRYKRPPRKQKASRSMCRRSVKPTPMKKQQRGPVIPARHERGGGGQRQRRAATARGDRHREEPASWRIRRRARHDAGGAQAVRRCRRCAVPRDEAPDRHPQPRRSGRPTSKPSGVRGSASCCAACARNDRTPGPAPALTQRAGKAELLTGSDAASSRPVRKIVLRAERG
jgi:hypothetical protein